MSRIKNKVLSGNNLNAEKLLATTFNEKSSGSTSPGNYASCCSFISWPAFDFDGKKKTFTCFHVKRGKLLKLSQIFQHK